LTAHGRLPYRAGEAKVVKQIRKKAKSKLEKAHLRLRVNGDQVEVAFAPHKTLLEVLREDLMLTGTKHGCELGAAQCGYCTPGILLTAKALLENTPRPSRDEIKEALAGNLCRCTGYIKILEAVELAAARMAGEQAEPAKETVYGWE
jgi:aerobic-type carbon monoxide dehydrogenase small subunit (CoxS/CutS family)